MEMMFPRNLTCVLCHEESDDELCDVCKGSIQFNIGQVCESCGRMILKSHYPICQHCKSIERFFDRGISVAVYDDFTKKMIFDLKYHNKKYIAHTMARYMLDYITALDHAIDFDWIVPVPLHKDKLKRRGFNQTLLISDYLAKMCGIKVNNNLIRSINTKPLNKLSLDERVDVLTEAFELKASIRGNIILVDDIFTTGTTLNMCSKVLKEKGAGYIMAITFAVGE